MGKEKRESLRRELVHAARAAGGGHETVGERTRMAHAFCTWLRANNIQVRTIDAAAKVRYVRDWIVSGQVTKRSAQNRAAALRCIFRAAGREKFAAHRDLTNKALGIGGASREGTHRAITDAELDVAKQRAEEAYPREAAVIEIARAFGLRSEEALQSGKSLPAWRRELARGDVVQVIYGTKGGRPRDVHVPPELLDRARAAVMRGLEITGGKVDVHLVDKPDLEKAKKRLGYVASRIGLVGQISPHSVRYAWAQERLQAHQEAGHSRADSLALTSMSLGHGDGRGRYVERVYARK